MTGKSKITEAWLEEQRACREGMAWFLEHFPQGGAYQEVREADKSPYYRQTGK